MHRAVSAHPGSRPRAWQRSRQAAGWLWRALLLSAMLAGPVARAADPQLAAFEVVHNDEGVLLTYAINGDLSRSVDDALSKGVPLYFVAEAEMFRDRWYWRDRRVATATRVWRIVFQPLTSTYRVTFSGLSQNYNSRDEAFAAISRTSRWKVAEPGQIEEGSRHYVEFSYRLDTSLLPRPMQIGIGGQPDWNYSVQRVQRIN
jgi:Domain of unknown function (DUF4390)